MLLKSSSKFMTSTCASRRYRKNARTHKRAAGLTPIYEEDEREGESPLNSYDAYDARIERHAALADKSRGIRTPIKPRLSANDVNQAMREAEIGCLSSAAQCAALWDIADEMWLAYMRQVAIEDEEARKKLQGEEWALKCRTYDL